MAALTASRPGTAADGPDGVRLLSTSGSSVRFEVTVPRATLTARPPAPGAEAAVRLDLPGFTELSDALLPGGPARIVVVAVPPLGAVRVSATGAEPEVRDGVRLESAVPIPGDGTLGTRARLLEVGWMRNQRIARIAVFAADVDRGARRLTLWHRIEVAVEVEPAGDLGPPAEEPDPMEHAYRAALVNYEQGRGWRRPSTVRLADLARRAAPARGSAALAGLAAAVPETSVYVGREWFKIAVQRSGFYKIDFGRLRTIGMTACRMDSLRLFNWPGVPVLPRTSYCDTCDLREVAIRTVDAGEDGMYSANTDEFVFFAMGPSDWASLYDATRPETLFVNHPYEVNNYYYLTVATEDRPVGGTPVRMASVGGEVTHPEWPVPATFPARQHFEQDLEFHPNASPLFWYADLQLFWEKWFWRGVEQGNRFQYNLELPAADTTQPARLRALTWGLNYNPPPRGSLPDHYVDVGFNGTAFPTRSFDYLRAQVYDTTVTDLRRTGNQFSISVPSKVDPGNIYRRDVSGLAWFDLFYRSAFQPRAGGRLDFDTPEGGNGDVRYRIGPFPDGTTVPYVFDVTDPLRPVKVEVPGPLTEEGDTLYLYFQAQETSRRRYRVLPPDSVLAVAQQNVAKAPATSLENLRSASQRADYILVYYDGFRTAADSLAAWRRLHLPLPGTEPPYETKIVPVSALYDQFSGGRTDPGAIRNFLRAAFYNWNDRGTPRRPTFVTLLGDASPDYKNISGHAATGQPGCLLPTYEDNFDGQVLRQFTTDDWMMNVDNAFTVIPDFLGGRIPVDDANTALGIVRSKVLEHERRSPLGEWRNRVMLMADDDMQGQKQDPLAWRHLQQTMELDAGFTPPHLDRDYIYLHTFDPKSAARDKVRDDIREGIALMNYVGHGSPVQLADEIMLLDTDVGNLTNSPRLPVFVSASCDVGKFSDYLHKSLGEGLVASTVGGAIGVISSTELAFSDPNARLNQRIYQQIFRRDTSACGYHVTLAEALLAAKTGNPNEQKYQLMGDAASLVASPRLWVDIALTDSAGVPVTEIRRGGLFRVSGQVRDCPGGQALPFDGTVSLLIEDSQEIGHVQRTPIYTYDDSCTYFYKAGAVYRGDIGVRGGTFGGRFVVPLEAREGGRGRLRAYIEGRVAGEAFETDGTGVLGASVASGSAPADDGSGPRITLSFVGGATTVRPDAVLQVDLYDPSGILTTDHTPQNGIIVTLDGNTTSRADVTGSFRYAADSYQSGAARFQLPNLPLGPHTVTVTAADNLAAGLVAAAHRSKASLDFTVVEQPDLRIAHAYLFPNPTESAWGRGGGQFVVDCPGDSVNVLLRIYTVTGRLIRTLKTFGGLGQVQVPWDGLDDEGHPLANGVYLFRVHVNPRDADGASSARKKAEADGRFVIVNRE